MSDQTDAETKRAWKHNKDNRERLIAAGYAILAEKGIEAATVKEIARHAGVSPGLFHYYFSSKDELLLAVLYEAGQRFKDQLQVELRAAMATEGFAVAAVAATHALGRRDPTWYRLRYELYALGLRKPDFLPEIGAFLATARQEMTRMVAAFAGMDEARAHAVAAVLLAAFDGLALQQLAQPDLDLTAAYDALQRLLSPDSPG